MKREAKKYRAINFDLKLKLLREYYPKKNILNAYKDIKSFMIGNGFSHRQWSGYRSNEKLTDRQVRNLMLKMRYELSWIDKCSTKIDVTNIGKIYDIKGFYASYDADEEHKDIEKLFRDSEIDISEPVNKNVKSLEDRIKTAKQIVKESDKNKSVAINKKIESYAR